MTRTSCVDTTDLAPTGDVLGYSADMRSRLVTLLVLLLALAVPLQGLLASAWPVERAEAEHAAMVVAADEASAHCHGHGQDSGTPADSSAGCGCCAVCGSAALPAAAPLLARSDLRCTTAAAPPAAAVAFVTEGPERPPRG
jgi:hypothetical protein